eukprot:9501978-Pyramimonas_sp.AAC.2
MDWREWPRALKQVLKIPGEGELDDHLGGRQIRMATACSGTDSAAHALHKVLGDRVDLIYSPNLRP